MKEFNNISLLKKKYIDFNNLKNDLNELKCIQNLKLSEINNLKCILY